MGTQVFLAEATCRERTYPNLLATSATARFLSLMRAEAHMCFGPDGYPGVAAGPQIYFIKKTLGSVALNLDYCHAVLDPVHK